VAAAPCRALSMGRAQHRARLMREAVMADELTSRRECS